MATNIQLRTGGASDSFRLLSRRVSDERVIERLGCCAADLWPGREASADDAALSRGWNAAPIEASRTVDDDLRFAAGLKGRGIEVAAVLGMGGSAHGAKTLIALGARESGRGRMPVVVLDTIVPERVLGVSESIDFEKTLFIVASRSGTTVETMLLYRYFRQRVDEAVGQTDAARRFAAVTVPGSPLAVLAKAEGFLRYFECPKDVGGRFSSLTHFGLMPAALAGVDIRATVDRAVEMHRACREGRTQNNPGASLGVWLASLMREGRNKLTFITSPGVRPLAAWIEHLVAESTGKDGAGLVPVLDEPRLDPSSYGDDRAFVRLTLAGEDETDTDRFMRTLAGAGHPVAEFPPLETLDLGAEMYRWQFATVEASSLTGLWPFDQQDVQGSKDMAQRIMASDQPAPKPEDDCVEHIASALRNAPEGGYLAVMAFAHATPELDEALQKLRQTVGQTLGIPVTVGYGPEFLHATGQLHKGGPRSLVGLQILARDAADVRVRGDAHTFGDVLAAQADGDLRVLRGKGVSAFRLRCGAEGPASAVLELCRAIRRPPSV